MSSPDLKDSLFVPLSTHFLVDEKLARCSLVAELLYVRSLLHSKRAASDGVVSLRLLIGELFDRQLLPGSGDLVPAQFRAAARELATALVSSDDQPLWTPLDSEGTDGDRFRVTQFTKHNDPAEVVENRKRAASDRKRVGAMKTNHKLGRHQDPVPGCPLCSQADDDVPPGQNAPDAPDIDSESLERDASDAPDADSPQTQLRRNSPPSQPQRSTQDPPSTGSGGGEDPADEATRVVDTALVMLGLAEPELRELLTVRRALARGWTAAELVDIASEASARTDIDRPRNWVFKAWEKRSNRTPDGTEDVKPIGGPPAVGRRRVHPEDCPGGCSDEGWVDGPNGRLVKCTGQPIEASA